MFLQKHVLFLFLFINFFKFCNTLTLFANDGYFKDFTVDMAAGNVIKDDDINNVTYICGTNLENDCECKPGVVKCINWLKNANVRPLKDDFEIRLLIFRKCNITTLKRDKILSGNEDTVEDLRFDSTGIQFIDAGAFDKFILLKELSVNGNSLENVDESVLTPTLGETLSSLTLRENKITALNPMVFKNMKILKTLRLNENPTMKSLTDIFPEMALEWLDLGNCGLTSLEENVFKNLHKLELLQLNNNKFSSIPSAIKHLPSLTQLEMGDNLLTKIETNTFISNPKLHCFIFYRNPLLLSIEDCAFCGIGNISWIYGPNCPRLSFIDENAFGAISTGTPPAADLFSVSECNITVLSKNLLDWKNVKHINIGGNPLACNCSMAWLFSDLLSDSSEYNKKINRRFHGHKYVLGCFPPLDIRHKPFLKLENISGIFEPCKQINATSNFSFWMIFLIGFGFIGIIGVHVFRHHQINFMPYFTNFRDKIIAVNTVLTNS